MFGYSMAAKYLLILCALAPCKAFTLPRTYGGSHTLPRTDGSPDRRFVGRQAFVDAGEDEGSSVLGAASLVAGNMVGGGILAIPTVAQTAGFIPSAVLMIGLWAACTGTGILLGEVAGAAVRSGEDDVSLRRLSQSALGDRGAALTSTFFAATNLLLMAAFIAHGGDTLFGDALGHEGFVAPRVLFALGVAALSVAPAAAMEKMTGGRRPGSTNEGVEPWGFDESYAFGAFERSQRVERTTWQTQGSPFPSGSSPSWPPACARSSSWLRPTSTASAS